MNTQEIDLQKTVVKTLLQTLVAAQGIKEEAELKKALDGLKSFGPKLTQVELDEIFNQVLQQGLITIDTGVVIEGENHEPWLEKRKGSINWVRWNAYNNYLASEGRPPAVITALGDSLDQIVDHLGNPAAAAPWQVRGLVVGDVQSGKTGTYLGLINKAIDVGYRYVILLTGHTESLRQQTQARLDQGAIGRDSKMLGLGNHAMKPVGVGNYLPPKTAVNVIGLTTATSDFRVANVAAMNFAPGPDVTVIFATKKNKSTLTNVTNWLKSQAQGGQVSGPMLLIDDESDYYSVNTNSPEKDPAVINKCIRDLLKLFSRNSYVAFTATPFANIFIDDQVEDDLFPKDFIYALEAPSNYVGPSTVFGSEADNEEMVLILEDAEDFFPLKHKQTLVVNDLPESLYEAIRVFFLSNAIRDLRGDSDAERSMMINVSRLVKVQEAVYELVKNAVATYRNAIELHAPSFKKGDKNSILNEFEETFNKHFSNLEIGWDAVLGVLPLAVSGIQTKISNSKTEKELSSGLINQNPKRVVAVGGDLLSRGLTLEGLMTSYFYRNTGAYDTLMQMGRWFGYRDGYFDITRIWISEDMASAFAHISDTLQHLRYEIALMRQKNLTPRQFGLAIKDHPDALLITARNKMRSAARGQKKKISLRGQSIESPKLSSKPADVQSNFEAAQKLVEDLFATSGNPLENLNGTNRKGWIGVDKKIVGKFFEKFVAHNSVPVFSQGALGKYISAATAKDLSTWDVVFMNGEGQQLQIDQLVVDPPQRSLKSTPDGAWLVSSNKRRVAGVGDIGATLPKAERDAIRKAYLSLPGNEGKSSVPDANYIEKLTSPSLLIYLIEAKQPSNQKVKEKFPPHPVVAVKFSVPWGPGGISQGINEDGVTYVLNRAAQDNWLPDFSEEILEAKEDEVDE